MILIGENLAPALLAWFDRHRRDLPWRVVPGSQSSVNPWLVIVSELMLQQTQVSVVIPYFQKFLAEFPTPADLAAAPLQKVLRLWQGLGYYSRARHLHAAAKVIARDFNGNVPRNAEDLLALPGVGRYTAGAVASIAFGVRAPILDGNVARVLSRLVGIRKHHSDRKTNERLWKLAAQILPTERIGDFNSALMELGATVCIPRAPRCSECPLKKICVAYAKGIQNFIPPPRKSKPTPLIERWTFCLRNGNHWLIEQRPARGRWAGMWQFVTIPSKIKLPNPATIHQHFGLQSSPLKSLGEIRHALTHRRYVFNVFAAEIKNKKINAAPRRWATLSDLNRLPLSRPQSRIAMMLPR